MKLIKWILTALLLLGAASAIAAGTGHQHSHPYSHPYSHSTRVGVFIDPWPLFFPGPFYYPYGYPYPYPYRYYPEVVVTPSAPTTYIEQGDAAISPAPAPVSRSNDWFYCNNPDGYYPYVKSCPGGWQRVPAQPPPSR